MCGHYHGSQKHVVTKLTASLHHVVNCKNGVDRYIEEPEVVCVLRVHALLVGASNAGQAVKTPTDLVAPAPAWIDPCV